MVGISNKIKLLFHCVTSKEIVIGRINITNKNDETNLLDRLFDKAVGESLLKSLATSQVHTSFFSANFSK